MPVDTRQLRGVFAAFALGLVHACALSWPELWWLQLLAVAGLALVLAPLSIRPAALAGFGFGLGWFVAGVAWLFISMHRYGGLPAPLAVLALLLFCAYLALFPCLACTLSCLVNRGARDRPVAFASALGSAFVLAEWLRGWLFTGFPWLSPGYAHTDGPFAGLAPWLGVYGVGGLAIFSGAALGLGAMSLARRATLAIRPIAAALLAALLALLGGQVQWGEPHGQALRVDLLQGNIEQEMKFNPERTLAAMRWYVDAIETGKADLVVMPETAWTLVWSHTPQSIVSALRERLTAGAQVVIGMPLLADKAGQRISNSMAVIDAGGAVVARYDKRHLVPFGEFIPPGFGWFVKMMNIPLGDFHRGGDEQALVPAGDHRIGFNICYEDLFGAELARQVRAGATLLINASNIAWFGQSHALPQHLEIARMRALELARPMLRATNTGVTAAIDHRGRVVASLEPYTAGSLRTSIAPVAGLTPFARWGDWPAVILALLTLIALLIGARTSKQSPRAHGAQ